MISPKFVPRVRIKNIPALVQIMANLCFISRIIALLINIFSDAFSRCMMIVMLLFLKNKIFLVFDS